MFQFYSYEFQQANILLQFHKDIYIAFRVRVAFCNRTKYSGPFDMMPDQNGYYSVFYFIYFHLCVIKVWF